MEFYRRRGGGRGKGGVFVEGERRNIEGVFVDKKDR